MVRATKSDKVLELAERRVPPARTADGTCRGGPISGASTRCRRQAYRYLQEAAGLSAPVPSVEQTVAMTFKLPISTVRAIRAHCPPPLSLARSSGHPGCDEISWTPSVSDVGERQPRNMRQLQLDCTFDRVRDGKLAQA